MLNTDLRISEDLLDSSGICGGMKVRSLKSLLQMKPTSFLFECDVKKCPFLCGLGDILVMTRTTPIPYKQVTSGNGNRILPPHPSTTLTDLISSMAIKSEASQAVT